MGLYDQWTQMCKMPQTPEQQQAFWDEYFAMETDAYIKILENHKKKYSGELTTLAKELELEPVIFCGFIDGINTSLTTAYEVEKLEETSQIDLNIDFEKLFFNMLDAKAKWLYTLEEWEEVLPKEKRTEITQKWRASKQAVTEKTVGRNDPCPCGSGKKYKKCCFVK